MFGSGVLWDKQEDWPTVLLMFTKTQVLSRAPKALCKGVGIIYEAIIKSRMNN